MTPDILRVTKITTPDMCGAAELSSGLGIFGGVIYGVSVVQVLADDSTKRRVDLSKVFQARADADRYIRELGG